MLLKHKLNCFCARKPLLAMCGVDARGKVYVHVKVYKQHRVFAEIIAYDGEVKLNCRECYRWHTIRFKANNKAELQETAEPAEVRIEEVSSERHAVAAEAR